MEITRKSEMYLPNGLVWKIHFLMYRNRSGPSDGSVTARGRLSRPPVASGRPLVWAGRRSRCPARLHRCHRRQVTILLFIFIIFSKTMSAYVTKRTYVVLSVDHTGAQGNGVCVPVVVTDSFQKAVEAAEVHAAHLAMASLSAAAAAAAGATSTSKMPLPTVVAFLMEGAAPPVHLLEGFFGRWKSFSDSDGTADMSIFRRYKKPDGYLVEGAWREKPLFPALCADKDATVISVRAVFSEYFSGHYQSFQPSGLEQGEQFSDVCMEEEDDEEEEEFYSS